MRGSASTMHTRISVSVGLAIVVLATALGVAQQGARGGEWRWHSGDLGSTKYALCRGSAGAGLDRITRLTLTSRPR